PPPPVNTTPAIPQPHLQREQLPVAFQIPPPPISVVSVPPVSISPNRTTVFLPGDASRPLLGQGLFKIVPDEEDEAEALRAAIALERSYATETNPLDLNLDGDLISSVITYENQDDRFRAIEATKNGASSSGSKITSQSRNDKQEINDDEASEFGNLGPSRDVVIVGSDIVFEPLPSAKAAKAKAEAAEVAAAAAGNTPLLEDDTNRASVSSTASKKNPGFLERSATIGGVLPTMGTEEYLERTDDKEEYSYGLHGDRRTLEGLSSSTPKVIHPPSMTSLSQSAQGDIVASPALPPSTPGISQGALSPPPVIKATRPNMKS
ncbi:hypothetical protein BGZ76_005619, partial [Entomortierella beljakovae]